MIRVGMSEGEPDLPAGFRGKAKLTRDGYYELWYPQRSYPSSPVEFERQRLSNGKGGRIGTDGRTPVAFRFDDWQDQMLTLGIVDMMAERNFTGSIALCTELGVQSWHQTVTWDDIRGWCEQQGMEVWSHGTDHTSPDGEFDQFVEQIVTSKSKIEAEGLRCMGWAMPGVSANGGYGSSAVFTDPDHHLLPAGQMMQSTYALVETDMTGKFRHLPSDLHVGLGHYTISDGATLAQSKAVLDEAIGMGAGVEFMVHSGNLGGSGNMTVAQFEEFLDYVVAKETAGEAVVVAPSSLPFCDPGSSRWLNAAALSAWLNLDGSTKQLVDIADGPDGATTVLQVSGAGVPYGQILDLVGRGLAGQPLKVEGYARYTAGSDPQQGKIEAKNVNGYTPSYSFSKTFDLTSSWAPFRFVFTPPPTLDGINLLTSRGNPGATGTMQFADLALRPA